MAKNKAPAIQDVEKQLKQKKILPLYYLFGEDGYSIEVTVDAIEKAVQPFITSDFDNESFYAENQSFSNIISLASTFPFGSEKKLIIFKQVEKVKDKKELTSYAKSPADFTTLVCIHEGTISSADSEPFKTLAANGFLYEAKELKGKSLIEWLISTVEKNDKTISYDNAQLLTDISGENRNMLEAQLEKIFLYIGESKEITIDSIRGLSTSLKQYTIFDLQNAIGKKNKSAALKVLYNLLKNGMEPIQIVAMLNKYFTGLARLTELITANTNEFQIARILGTHPFYLKDYRSARGLYSDIHLTNAFSALLKADLAIKTTSLDDYTLLSVLIAEIIPD
ncbi:MAG TPA: DNA polymerase III subunit delta [Ignavibacteriales bacterium]|nr:DNA polymerase III subunit delta [Ignavibacteriales bacterium]